MQYNTILPSINFALKRYLPVLHSSQEILQIFPETNINLTYKTNKNLKKIYILIFVFKSNKTKY